MARRKRDQETCTCTAYAFPHRFCSGVCKLDGDMPAILRQHDRGRGYSGGEGVKAECQPGARKRHVAKGRHGDARAQRAAPRRAHVVIG